MPAMTTVSASNLCDSTGAKVVSAKIIFRPVTPSGANVSYLVGGGGLSTSAEVSATVENGVFSVSLADVSQTNPQYIGYAIRLEDAVSGKPLLFNGYSCFQPTGPSVALDLTPTDVPLQAMIYRGPTGKTGDPGGNGVASLAQLAAIQARQPLTKNLFNVATYTTQSYVDSTTGLVVSAPGFDSGASDFIPANSGGQMTLSMAPNFFGPAGIAFYDQNFVYLSGYTTPISAWGQFSVPTAAAWIRLTGTSSTIATMMVLNGAITVPVPFQSFGTYATNIIDEKDAAAAASALSIEANQVAVAQIWNALNDSISPAVVNMFDLAAITPDSLIQSFNGVPASFSGYFASDYMFVVSGKTYYMAIGAPSIAGGNYGLAYYDLVTRAFVSSVPWSSPANGYTFVAPITGWVRISGENSALPAQMILKAASYSGGYVPYVQSESSPTPGPTHATYSMLNGVKVAVFGTSISNGLYGLWQTRVVTRTGANNYFNDARPGRILSLLFECYGVTSQGTDMNPGSGAPTNQGTVTTPNGTYANNGTPGNTLAQDLLTAKICIVEIGTNDSGTPIGNLADAVTVNSIYGNVKWIHESLKAANPTMRVVFLIPYWSNLASLSVWEAVCAAYKAYFASVGAPVIDLLHGAEISSLTWAEMLRGDVIHPTDPYGYDQLGAYISNQLESLY